MNKLQEILNFDVIENEEIKSLFNKAEDYMNRKEYINALAYCDNILTISDNIDDFSIQYKAYMGLYLIWFEYCQELKQDSLMLGDFFRNVLYYGKKYAPKEELDKYINIFEENSKTLKTIINE